MSFVPGHAQLLSELVVLLKDVDWYMLGIHLHVPQDRLNGIQEENTDIVRRLTQVLQCWLNNKGMSWEKIVEALKKVTGHEKLINTIESKYIKPGKQDSGCISSIILTININSHLPHYMHNKFLYF